MLYRGLLATNFSGAVNGVVASRNRGGAYFRNRIVPIDPATSRQLNCRQAISDVYSWWSSTLSADDRAKWEAYARSLPSPNRIGDAHLLSGWSEFSRQAFLKFQLNEEFGDVKDPGTSPPTKPCPFATAPQAALVSANDTIRITWSSQLTWENDQDNFIAIFLGVPQKPTINFFKGPYQLMHEISGDPDDPPASGVDFALADAVPDGWKLPVRMRFCGNDFPLSAPYTQLITAIPP